MSSSLTVTSKNLKLLMIFILGFGAGFFVSPAVHENWLVSEQKNGDIQVCFSPEGQCINGIISTIDQSKESIYVMAYSFTSAPIAKALLAAYERGVTVKILVDKSQLRNKHFPLDQFVEKGILVLVDKVSGIAHNKTMIIDKRFILTGSYNWTSAANTRNAENILLIDDQSLAQIYFQNWMKGAKRAKIVGIKK